MASTVDAARACRARGVATVAVTAGYIHDAARREFYAAMDAANVDLKGFTEDFYRKLCFAHLEPVKETLVYLAKETDVWLEVTTLLIPDANDGDDEIARLCDWFLAAVGDEVPLHFTAFHPDFKLTDRPPTPPETLARARRRALAAGLRHVYTGNIFDPDGQSTRCAGCGAVVIARDGYRILGYALDAAGCCRACGRALPGRFGLAAGRWGSRRLRVAVS